MCAILLLELGAIGWLQLATPTGDHGSANAFGMMLSILIGCPSLRPT